jgi:hypothetical protein
MQATVHSDPDWRRQFLHLAMILLIKAGPRVLEMLAKSQAQLRSRLAS